MAAAGSASTHEHGQGMEPLSDMLCGRYRLQTLLGEGGAAQVFAAHDPLLDRQVALKILRAGLDGRLREASLRRFRVELKVFGRVSHPHVVGVYDANLEGDRPWLVMELCSGPTLSDWLNRKRTCSPGQAAQIFHQAALALDHIHALGIVHRDVKLANLLFHYKQLKLTDFGVAQAVFITEPPDGRMVGTPGYMPPEQYAGEKAGPRADLYSLAAVLYELLSGRRPLGDDPSHVLYDQEYDRIEPITQLAPDLMPDFDVFFERALARDPARRFGSGAEMVSALAQIVPEHELEGIGGTKTVSPGATIAPNLYGYSQAARVASVYQAQRTLREPPPPPLSEQRRRDGAVIPPWVKASPKLEKAREAFELLHFEEEKPSLGVQTLNALKSVQKEKRREVPAFGLPFADHGLHHEELTAPTSATDTAPAAKKARSGRTLEPGAADPNKKDEIRETGPRVITPRTTLTGETPGQSSVRQGSSSPPAFRAVEGDVADPQQASRASAAAPHQSTPALVPGNSQARAAAAAEPAEVLIPASLPTEQSSHALRPRSSNSLLVLAAVIGVLLTLAFFAGTRVGEQRARNGTIQSQSP